MVVISFRLLGISKVEDRRRQKKTALGEKYPQFNSFSYEEIIYYYYIVSFIQCAENEVGGASWL